MTATNEARASEPTSSGPGKQRHNRRNNIITIIIEALGALVQLLLVWAGIDYLFVDDVTADEQGRLLIWCIIATVYLAGTVFWLNIDLRVNDDDHQFMRRTSRHPIVAIFSSIVTFSSSLVGLSAAVTVIVGTDDPEYFGIFDLIAVWAMLASWAMFHWGYSRIYYAAYHLGAWTIGSSMPAAFSLTDTAALWENIGTIGRPLFTGLGIMAIFAAVTSYLLISQMWIWRVTSKRRGVRA